MTKRKLSKEEEILWQHYTKNIKKTTDQQTDFISEDSQRRVELKIPKRAALKPTPMPGGDHFENLKNKDSNWSKRLKQGKGLIEGKIDLHGMTCVQAYAELLSYLEKAQKKSKRVILVITGKGAPHNFDADLSFSDYKNSRGVLRREVPMWLSGTAMRSMIISFEEARIRHGGSGALYVILKRL